MDNMILSSEKFKHDNDHSLLVQCAHVGFVVNVIDSEETECGKRQNLMLMHNGRSLLSVRNSGQGECDEILYHVDAFCDRTAIDTALARLFALPSVIDLIRAIETARQQIAAERNLISGTVLSKRLSEIALSRPPVNDINLVYLVTSLADILIDLELDAIDPSRGLQTVDDELVFGYSPSVSRVLH